MTPETNAEPGRDALWGLWGGLRPGGWASFQVANDGGGHPFAYAGTRDEAEAGKLMFEREQAEALAKYGRPAFTYTVLPFDPSREPASLPKVPTPAQWWMLAIIRKYGTLNLLGLPATYNATLNVLHRNGWYRNNLTAEGREPVYSRTPFVPQTIFDGGGRARSGAT